VFATVPEETQYFHIIIIIIMFGIDIYLWLVEAMSIHFVARE